jgi:hypothetical protein
MTFASRSLIIVFTDRLIDELAAYIITPALKLYNPYKSSGINFIGFKNIFTSGG